MIWENGKYLPAFVKCNIFIHLFNLIHLYHPLRKTENIGEGNGNRLQYSYLGHPMNRGAWWIAVHRMEKSWT